MLSYLDFSIMWNHDLQSFPGRLQLQYQQIYPYFLDNLIILTRYHVQNSFIILT